jgi:exopolysaccharide biosynthesis polyprenyl glycosylphosphotransferase
VSSKSTPAALKPDLRSPTAAGLRRGTSVKWLRVILLLLLDAGAITLAWWLGGRPGVRADFSFLPVLLIVALGMIAARGHYKAGKYRRDYWGLVKAISLSQLIIQLIAFLYEPSYPLSRSAFLLSWLFSLLLVGAGRYGMDAATRLARQQGAVRYPVFLICDPEHIEQLTQVIKRENCYVLLGSADPGCLDRNQREATFESLRELGIIEAFVSWTVIHKRLYLCWHFQSAGITLRILPTNMESFLPRSELHMVGGVPVPTIQAPVIVGSDYWVKRCFDFCFSATALTILLSFYLLIALLIKLDSPGPVFFRQTRLGLHGRTFKVWKFRTMLKNADKMLTDLEAQNEMKDGVLFKIRDDPRITRVGHFLRRYSLDELPQLFNVLVGEMSLVGPRPHALRDVERFQDRHFIRQEVLPGITGLWQVSGRSNIDNFDEAANLDITYITNWSLWLDVKIIFKTIQVVLQREGAY